MRLVHFSPSRALFDGTFQSALEFVTCIMNLFGHFSDLPLALDIIALFSLFTADLLT